MPLPFNPATFEQDLQNPQYRATIVNHLMSTGQEPAAVMQSMMQNPVLGGNANQPPPPLPGGPNSQFAGDPGQTIPLPNVTRNPAPNPQGAGAGPWSFIYGDQPADQGMGGSMVTTPAAQGGMQLMPGESGGMPEQGTDWKKLLEGAAGMAKKPEQQQHLSAPAPSAIHWQQFKPEMVNGAAVKPVQSLSQILGR